MSLLSRLFPGLALAMRAASNESAGTPSLVTLPSRAAGTHTHMVSDDEAVSLIPIYRALQVLTTAAAQLSINVERGGAVISGRIPGLARRPDPDLDRSDWIEQAVLSLALDGNLFLRKLRGHDGTVVAARILTPHEVTITRHPRTGALAYHYRGETLSRTEIHHQTLMRLPGRDRGIGPIQAARAEISGALDVRDYASTWFTESGHPMGMLSLEKALTEDDAKAARNRWNEAAADPDNPTRVRVVGSGASYTPLMLSPEDAQWLEVRQFTVTDLARLFGIPSVLMLASVDGSSLTYSNVEQDWLAFTRFTLMTYVRKLEEALTEISPAGQTIRFDLEVLLRSDTRSRYEAHRIGIEAGFLTVDEVREIEGRPPLTADQRSRMPQTTKEVAA
ncbi:MAG: phage portal protein [Micrococcus sp.]|nr:phage portal protein [Micrococcus sp.]